MSSASKDAKRTNLNKPKQDIEHCSLKNPGPSGQGEGVAFKVKRIHTVYAIFQLPSFSVTF